MPLRSDSVGAATAPRVESIDARWTMAYAAGIGDALECYVDTRARPDVIAHPLFPVCFEWQPFLDLARLPGAGGLEPGERVRGVHATHDLVLHRPLRAGQEVSTTVTVAAVESRRPGAYQVVRLDTRDASGELLCTTWYGSLYRGVPVEGTERPLADGPLRPPPLDPGRPILADVEVPIAAGAAHVYTECARIWNPIHTDAAVATGAGLPGLILHGTATLAIGVSQVVARALGGEPERVARVYGRFGAMVPMPGVVTVRVYEPESDGSTRFEVRNAADATAVRDGFVQARSPAP